MSEQPQDPTTPAPAPTTAAKVEKEVFDEELIKKYPRSNKKIQLEAHKYGIAESDDNEHKGTTSFISPFGLQFQGKKHFAEGTLLKIHLAIPDYWNRKQRLVDYQRIDAPDKFKVLAKVVKTEDIGKRGRKKMVTVQVVNIDDVDEQVLKSYLQDG